MTGPQGPPGPEKKLEVRTVFGKAVVVPSGQLTTVVARCASDELATGGGVTASIGIIQGNTINPGWQHYGSPIGAPPTSWQLVYFNPGPNPVAILAFAECTKLINVL